MNTDNIIQFKNVSMQFQVSDGVVDILKDVSFSVQRNSFTVIFGPSGSGKSTILNILLGLLEPTKGSVTVAGKNLYDMSQNELAQFRGQNYGLVSQTITWVTSLSVLENIALPLYLKGMSTGKAHVQARESLEKVGMTQYADYFPTVLSIGQQQRIAMARATVETPMLLVADEPTGNLDSRNGDMIMKHITSFKNHDAATIILVTHNPEYLSLSDNRLFIKDGALSVNDGGYQLHDNHEELSASVPLNKVAIKKPVSEPVPKAVKK